jgi:prolyl oligopeptidase
MFKIFILIASVLFFLSSCTSGPKKIESYPSTASKTVINEYHGVKVEDPYRWLEDTKAPEVRDWAAAQTKLTKGYLGSLDSRKSYSKKLSKIMSSAKTSYYGLKPLKKGFLSFKMEPKAKQAVLVYLETLDDLSKHKVLVDPNKMSKDGALSISDISTSPSGETVAVVFNEAGKEVGNANFYKIPSGEKLKDVILKTHGPTAGGSLVWLSENEILHTRYPYKGEKPEKDMFFYQNLYKYKLGSSKSTYELGKGFAKISSINVQKAPDSEKVLATVQYGDSGKFSYYLRFRNGKWKKVLSHSDEVKEAFFGYGDQLFMITYKNSPNGKLVKVSAKNPSLKRAKTIVKEGKDSIVTDFYSGGVSLALEKHIVLMYQLGGPSEFRIFDYSGKAKKLAKEPLIEKVGGFVENKNGKGFYYSQSSFVSPYAYYSYDINSGESVKTKIGQRSIVDLSDVKVVREFAVSKDGTKVPVNIILPKNYKKGEVRPLILTGYGGYGVNISPSFQESNSVWLDKGGIYAVANLRGGGEYGKKWHNEGRLTFKQNVFDDFHAVSQHLVSQGYTSKKQLGIMGGSNGGLLMGAVMTQHPDDFKAVVTMVGIYDSLRSELSPNGAFNIPEFGTVEKKDEFKALYSYSPYHNAKKASYPAVLITTGINDNRVDPMHSLKMAAKLQSVNQSQEPVILRVDLDSGHGQGDSMDKRIKKQADVFSFFHQQLGM